MAENRIIRKLWSKAAPYVIAAFVFSMASFALNIVLAAYIVGSY